MSGTSSEYQRGLEEGEAKGRRDALLEWRARSFEEGYFKGLMDAYSSAAMAIDNHKKKSGQEPLEPITGQHSGSQAYQENDDAAS